MVRRARSKCGRGQNIRFWPSVRGYSESGESFSTASGQRGQRGEQRSDLPTSSGFDFCLEDKFLTSRSSGLRRGIARRKGWQLSFDGERCVCGLCFAVRMRGILNVAVPMRDNTGVMFESENAHRCGVECEQASGVGRQAEPASGQDTKNVAMGKDDRVAPARKDAVGDVLCTDPDLGDRFTFWDGIPPERPTWSLRLNLSRRAAFVSAVVPFVEI